jgi:hypothetical protein
VDEHDVDVAARAELAASIATDGNQGQPGPLAARSREQRAEPPIDAVAPGLAPLASGDAPVGEERGAFGVG